MARVPLCLLIGVSAVTMQCQPVWAQHWRPVSVFQPVPDDLGQPAPLPSINGDEQPLPNATAPSGGADTGNGQFAPPIVSPPYMAPGGCCFDGCCEDPTWSAGPPPWHHGWGMTHRWYAQADVLWLNRSDANRRNLTVEQNGDRIWMTTDDLDFDTTSGVRLTLGKFLDDCTALEGSFMGFHDWNAQRSVRGDDNLSPYWAPTGFHDGFDPPDIDGNFTGAVKHTANYATELAGAELGIRHWIDCDASLLFGFRFLTIDEDFDFFTYDTKSDVLDGVYSVHTDNELVGLQLGGDWSKPLLADVLRFTIAGKAGVFLNFAEQDSHVTRNATMIVRSRDADDTELASVLDLSVTLTLQISEHLSLRGGFNNMFITGLALGPDHLDGNPDRNNAGRFLSAEGSLHLFGPFVGGELVFP